MTREQIEALEPGWELDEAIAKTVTGWKNSPSSWTPEYSTDPVAHAALWDKLVADGWSASTTTNFLDGNRMDLAEIWKYVSIGKHFVQPGQTRYHALAKASLLAYSEPS